MEKTYQLASFVSSETGEVRHLLIEEVNGHAITDLILITGGKEEKLFSGTEFESRQKADELGQAWAKRDGFTCAKQNEPPYEPLAHAVKLAMRLGHDAIYDPRLVQMDLRKPNRNPTGLVALKNWPGMQAKNGGTYKYAVTLMEILAEPVPQGYPKLTPGPDFAQQLLEVLEAKKSVGPSQRFLFAGMTLVP